VRVFEKRVLRIFGSQKEEVTGEWRKIHVSPIFEHCSHPCTHFHKHAEVSGEFLQQGFPL
jgi:hypothetical protein